MSKTGKIQTIERAREWEERSGAKDERIFVDPTHNWTNHKFKIWLYIFLGKKSTPMWKEMG